MRKTLSRSSKFLLSPTRSGLCLHKNGGKKEKRKKGKKEKREKRKKGKKEKREKRGKLGKKGTQLMIRTRNIGK
jgi:hypothetical protein